MYPNCSSAFTPYLVRTLHGYHHSSPSSASAHLAFDPDQLILVITKHASGWWDGELVLDGKRGWFPGHYVEAVKAAEPEGATPPPPYEGVPAKVGGGMTRSETVDSVVSGMAGFESVPEGLAIIAVAHVVRRRS